MLGKAPETVKNAVVITRLMTEKCHSCVFAGVERHFGKNYKVPIIESQECVRCIGEKRKELFKEG